MTVRVGINGFGRIGRNFYRAVLASGADIEMVGVNDLTDNATLAHLLKYDTILGRLALRGEGDRRRDHRRRARRSRRSPSGTRPSCPGATSAPTSSSSRPASSRTRTRPSAHVDDGAKKVIISAPAKNEDITIVMGVNHEQYDAAQHTRSSPTPRARPTASPRWPRCSTTAFGIQRGLMTTIHAYTQDQNLQDGPHKDLRRARAAALNIVPTSTGAAKAIGLVLPELKGKLDGYALRVPIPTGSATDLTVTVGRETTVDEVNAAFKAAAEGALKGILAYTEDADRLRRHRHRPGLVHLRLRPDQGDRRPGKVVGWYDNEWGYSNRLVDLVQVRGRPQLMRTLDDLLAEGVAGRRVLVRADLNVPLDGRPRSPMTAGSGRCCRP